MKKILLVHAHLGHTGGGNVVAAWLLEALKREYAVTLFTWDAVDLAAINRSCGTSLAAGDFTLLRARSPISPLFRLDPDPGSIQRINYLLRLCKRLTRDYDLFATADMMEADFGRRGLQYVHYPWLARHAARPPADGSTCRRLAALLRGAIPPWMYLSHYSFERMRGNLTLVNSDWTGRRVRDAYGIEPRTVYPPVPGDYTNREWERRENGFICIGRLCPPKRIEIVVGILAQVRASVPDLRLYIVGARGHGREERAYWRRLELVLAANAAWIELHEDLARDELVRLACGQRYGIHAQVDEHFGIAVAEMVRAGCIPFVHDSGGQVEIVGRDPRLLYSTTTEAVQRILVVLKDAGHQADLRCRLDARKELFSERRFVREIRGVVRELIESQGAIP